MFLIIVSLLFAICHGSALPLAMYVFGDLTNLFANYDITLQVFENTTNEFRDKFGNFTAMKVDPGLLATQDNFTEFLLAANETFELNLTNESVVALSCAVYTFAEEMEPPLTGYEVFELLTKGNLTLSATNGTCNCLQPFFTTEFSEDTRCLTDDAFIFGTSIGDGVVWQIYYFIFIAVGVFISAYFQISLMQTSAGRQVNRIRKLYYQSVLRQDIGWFDCNPSGELATRLNE